MRAGLLIILSLSLFLPANAQSLNSINAEELSNILGTKNDTVYVVNFWATWCSPCVAEIGFFEDLHRTYTENTVKVILINLDFPDKAETRVLNFLVEKEITATVYNMTDLDYNKWIPMVSADWSGAIPATLIFNSREKVFFEQAISKAELFAEVRKLTQ